MIAVTRTPCDEGVIRGGPVETPCAPETGRWVLAATILGSSMAFIDGTVVNVALPRLQDDLDATAAGVQWVVESYALFLAALILVGGSLGDRYGRRRIFAAGVVLFTLASVWCGLAPDVGQLIAARAVQGIGGALLVPGSLAIISAAFADEERGKAIGTWSGFTAITTALGPVLGGWLVDNASWRWVFFINVPLAAVVLAITLKHVPESRDEEVTGRLDWFGAALVTIGLGASVFGLIEAPSRGWGDPAVLAGLVIGVAALIGFVLTEMRTATPMLPFPLFRSRTFSGANLLTLFLYGALGGALFYVPFALIQVHGYSSTAAGAAFLPFILLMFVLSRWAGGLIRQFGAKPPLIVGPTIAAVGFLLFAVPGTGGSYWTTFFPAVVVLGLGMAITVAPLTTTVMGALEERHAGLASGINNAVARMAGLLAIAVFGIVVAAVFDGELDDRLSGVDLSPEARQEIDGQRDRLAGAEAPADLPPETATTVERAVDESFLSGFRVVLIISAGLGLASAAAAWIMVETSGANRRS